VYYTQVLRVTRGLRWLVGCEAALFVLVVTIVAANGLYQRHLPEHHDNLPLPAFFAIASFIAAVFISRYARTLSEENEQHLPLVWTMPVSRSRYALTVAGIDALGIVAAFAVTMFTVLSFIATLGGLRFIDVTADSGMQLLRFFAFPLAMYGMMFALTDSFGRAGRGLIGWAWVAMFVIGGLAAAPFAQPWSSIFKALDIINPLAYAGYSHSIGHDTVNVMGPSALQALALGVDSGALAIMCLAGLLAGVWQWNRLEA
jgi:hypothetical protein